jgi:hypothetical protein
MNKTRQILKNDVFFILSINLFIKRVLYVVAYYETLKKINRINHIFMYIL